MKDAKKFCRPKITKNPKFGDVYIKLNCGKAIPVSAKEYNKIKKYFKIDSVVGSSPNIGGNLLVKSKLLGVLTIVSPENFNPDIFELKEIIGNRFDSPYTGHNYVDLGLPSGTKWATMNVGAETETDFGNYYQYGKGADIYSVTNGQIPYDGYEDPLDLSVDTARQSWGGLWHMPTYDQILELMNNTAYEPVMVNNVAVGKFTAPNGNYIIIPAAGFYTNYDGEFVGTAGMIITSTPQGQTSGGFALIFDENDAQSFMLSANKGGASVRPVNSSAVVPPPEGTILAQDGDIIVHNNILNQDAIFSFNDWINANDSWEITGLYGIETFEEEDALPGYNIIMANGTTLIIKPKDYSKISNNWEIVDTIKDPRVIAKYIVSDTSNQIKLCDSGAVSLFSVIEIDGIEQQNVVNTYTFNTLGEHTIKYTLIDPTSIGRAAFNGCSDLISIEIPDSVTTINMGAFQNCSSLTNCTIGSEVTSIGNGTFYSCTSLTSINIPDNVTSIGVSAFDRCSNLTSVVIGNGVTSISQGVFYSCTSLTSITIGNSVTSIGLEAFYDCHSLTSIIIPDSVISISEWAFSDCSGLTNIICNATTAPTIQNNTFFNVKTDGILTVPDNSTGYDVWLLNTDYYLGSYDWNLNDGRIITKYNVTDTSSQTKLCNSSSISQFSEIEIDGIAQSSVVSEYTFSTTGKHTVKYTLIDPTNIGDSAFQSCSSLTNIFIPDSVTTINNSAFNYCTSLTSIDIPDSVISIGSSVFENCINLTSCTIGSGVTSIGTYAFYQCSSLTNIDIPDNVISIGDYTFEGCSNLTSVTIGSGITNISDDAFGGCSNLTNIDIPNSVISIGNNAFSGCSGLTSITIPDSVTSVDYNAFENCSNLTSVIIGSGVTSIGNRAFGNCTKLTSIVSNRTTAPTIQSTTFIGVKTNGTLTVPSSSTGYNTWMQNADYYLGLYDWDLNDGRLIAKYNITNASYTTELRTSYENNIFKSMEIDGVMLDELVTTYKFDTTGIHTVKYELYNETKLGNSAPVFMNNDLVNVIIPNSVTSIGQSVFGNCSGLTSVTIGNSVTSIGQSAFRNCSSLTSITIPDSVTTIGVSAFESCGLTSIDIPDNVISISDVTFKNCSSLTSVTIGSGVTTIGNNAFSGCSGITSMMCKAMTAPTISSYTFKDIKIGGTLTVPTGSTGYNIWMGTGDYYLGEYNWNLVDDGKVVAKYNVTNTSSPTALRVNYEPNIFKSMEIDGVVLDELVTEYTFNTTGVHIVRYELYNETKLGNQAPVFYNITNLVECIISNNVTNICNNIFMGCTNLTSVTIGNSVTSIGNTVFQGCSGLTNIICNAMTAPTITDSTFVSIKTDGTLTVPVGSTGYDAWMSTLYNYLGFNNWTKVEQ